MLPPSIHHLYYENNILLKTLHKIKLSKVHYIKNDNLYYKHSNKKNIKNEYMPFSENIITIDMLHKGELRYCDTRYVYKNTIWFCICEALKFEFT